MKFGELLPCKKPSVTELRMLLKHFLAIADVTDESLNFRGNVTDKKTR